MGVWGGFFIHSWTLDTDALFIIYVCPSWLLYHQICLLFLLSAITLHTFTTNSWLRNLDLIVQVRQALQPPLRLKPIRGTPFHRVREIVKGDDRGHLSALPRFTVGDILLPATLRTRNRRSRETPLPKRACGRPMLRR